MILHIDLCFLWEKPKDSYGKSEILDEYVCDEAYVTVILLDGSQNWLTKDISTNEKTQFWQTDQSQNFVVLCELPHQTNPRN